MKAVFFDLDGTLVESLPGLTEALNRTLADLNKEPLAPSTVRTYIGNGLWMLIRRALSETEFSDKQVTELQSRFMQHYKNTWRAGTVPFDGIKDLIVDLSQTGFTLGVLSNKTHHFTVAITEDLFGQRLIPHICGQKDNVAKKPDPASLIQLCEQAQVTPADTVLVGDSTVDLETAINAKTKAIGATWGYHNAAALEKYKLPLATTVDELRSLLLSG